MILFNVGMGFAPMSRRRRQEVNAQLEVRRERIDRNWRRGRAKAQLAVIIQELLMCSMGIYWVYGTLKIIKNPWVFIMKIPNKNPIQELIIWDFMGFLGFFALRFHEI